MKTLSIKQPWAWLIIHAGKDIENRDWRPKFRGRFLVHASKGCTRDEYDWACGAVDEINRRKGTNIIVPPLADLQRGGVIGSVEAVDCVAEHQSPWFFGAWGLVLRDPKPLPFISYKGQLQFFDVPDELVGTLA